MQVFCALLEKNITMNEDVDVMGIAHAKRDKLDFIIMPTIFCEFRNITTQLSSTSAFLGLVARHDQSGGDIVG
jgi:hypothetical protein